MILDRIVSHKRKEVQAAKEKVSLSQLQDKCTNRKASTIIPFSRHLRKEDAVSLIAEIKKASPSKGIIRDDFDPEEIAKIYSESGASAISVLTDREFFSGDPEYLTTAKKVSHLPVLRKDFIIDPYQLYEAFCWGADAVLLIAAILTDRELVEFQETASALGIECLIEVHTELEMLRTLNAGATLIGVNNRNLQTFNTDLSTTFVLRQIVKDPNITLVSESGINSRTDVIQLQMHGIHAMLVGEALMRERDIGDKINELLGEGHAD